MSDHDAPHAEPDPGDVGSVHVIIDPDVVHVVLAGEIDAGASEDLLSAAADVLAAGLPVEVDCRAVTFMDSAGIGFLARLAARSTHRVRLLHPPRMIRFLLETVRISSLVDIVD